MGMSPPRTVVPPLSTSSWSSRGSTGNVAGGAQNLRVQVPSQFDLYTGRTSPLFTQRQLPPQESNWSGVVGPVQIQNENARYSNLVECTNTPTTTSTRFQLFPLPPLHGPNAIKLKETSFKHLTRPHRSWSCPSDTLLRMVQGEHVRNEMEQENSTPTSRTSKRKHVESETVYTYKQQRNSSPKEQIDAFAPKLESQVGSSTTIDKPRYCAKRKELSTIFDKEQDLNKNENSHDAHMKAELDDQLLYTCRESKVRRNTIDLSNHPAISSNNRSVFRGSAAVTPTSTPRSENRFAISNLLSESQTQSYNRHEKKKCNIPQCNTFAVTQGLCIGHGGGRRCQRNGCTRGAQSKGLCVTHGGGRICRHEGCTSIQRSMGYCIRHGGGRRCSVKDCPNGAVRQDLCTVHGGIVYK